MSWTGAAARCAGSWWRYGRPTPPAATPTSSTGIRRRSTPTSPASARCLTDDDGRYSFTTIKPAAYPWRNHVNAWRPAHIHFSLFGEAFVQRLVSQMYFPNDPLFAHDPILQAVTDPAARDRLVAAYDHDLSTPERSLGYRWDIVLDGPAATWFEEGRD
jgi:protocatechuate 3,4-dioxygenase beta subunit